MVASLRTQEYERLRPTFTHYAIAKLVEDGVVRHVITQVTIRWKCLSPGCISARLVSALQNADGLHALSGVPAEKLSSLHGDAFTEYCVKCGTGTPRRALCLGGQTFSQAQKPSAVDRRIPPSILRSRWRGRLAGGGVVCRAAGREAAVRGAVHGLPQQPLDRPQLRRPGLR